MVGFPRKAVGIIVDGDNVNKVMVHKDTLPALGINLISTPYDEDFLDIEPQYYWYQLDADVVYACVFVDDTSKKALIRRYLVDDVSVIPQIKLLSKLNNNDAVFELIASSRKLNQGQEDDQ